MLTEVRDCDLLIVVTSSTFKKRKDVLKEKKQLAQIIKTRSPAYIWTNVLCTPIRSTCILRFSRSGCFWLSRCPSHTWAHIKYPRCTRVYEHTHTHHPNTRQNRDIYKTNPLSLPLPKYSLHQQQALTMNKLKQTPLPIPPHTRMQVLRNTCNTRACSREIGQYK